MMNIKIYLLVSYYDNYEPLHTLASDDCKKLIFNNKEEAISQLNSSDGFSAVFEIDLEKLSIELIKKL